MSSYISKPNLIGIIHTDVRREYYLTEQQYISDSFDTQNAQLVQKYLEEMGYKTTLLPGDNNLPYALRENSFDMVFNLVDSIRGDEHLISSVPALLELLNIPYTGSGVGGLTLSNNRFLSYKLLQQNAIPVPHFQLITSINDPIDMTLRYPLISKLNETHGSVEITTDSVSENEKHLKERIKFLLNTYHQPVLISEFIAGEEVAAFVVEGLNKKVYLSKKIFNNSNKYQIHSFETKWEDYKTGFHYEKYQSNDLSNIVKKAFKACQIFDYAKFEILVDPVGRYYFIDVNPNPFFGSKEIHGAIGIVLDLYGISFKELLNRLIINTMVKPSDNSNNL